MPRAKHNPELTMGGSREAEMAVPTIALNPPLDTARITATPEGAATMNPIIKLITERRRGDESGRREGGQRKAWHAHFPRDFISALSKLSSTKGLAQKPMIKPVSRDTRTPAASFLMPLETISPLLVARPKVMERIGPIRGDTEERRRKRRGREEDG